VLGFGQHYVQRDPWTNYRFFKAATEGLPTRIIGPGSEVVGGPGELSFDDLRGELRRARVLLYSGTQPASYTLGLIEAMMTGLPVVSMGPRWFDIFPYGPEMFEGHEIVGSLYASDDPVTARTALVAMWASPMFAAHVGAQQRGQTIELFGIDTIRPQWAEFLGVRVAVAA